MGLSDVEASIFLYNWLTDGSKVALNPWDDFCYSFLLEVESILEPQEFVPRGQPVNGHFYCDVESEEQTSSEVAQQFLSLAP
jgi:hypothetical protein